MLEIFQSIREHLPLVIEILLVSIAMYLIMRRFMTRNWARLLTLLGTILILLYLTSIAFELIVIRWLVLGFAFFFAMSIIIAFQPEVRRALADLGSRGFLFFSEGKNKEFIDDLADAVRQLGAKRCGALFAIERRVGLNPHLETGVNLDARFSPELLLTIFHPKTTLHDGAVILREGKVISAACVLPLSQKEIGDHSIGLRHRAGLGLTEESDAICIIVSEETGELSLAHEGELERGLEPETFHKRLLELLEVESENENHPEPVASPADPPKPKGTKKSAIGKPSEHNAPANEG
ncbi:MAG: TIGR00159 family protein [Verrucomicrobiaceae bacterium]|nr:TIGR00159 family protein [Verrucomicrobiaceae bacterium]